MTNFAKMKEWINENAPMLNILYQNKYVGMGYDRFASLPAKQQKQVILGSIFGALGLFVLYLLVAYITLWSTSRATQQSYAMVNVLEQYQKTRRDRAPQIQQLERNSRLAGAGQFKQHLLDQGRNANVSPRMMDVEERSAGVDSDPKGGGSDLKMRQAKVTLQKVNLNQLKSFLQNIEFGQYNLSVSSIKISNDSDLRGYMKVEMGVVAYLFKIDESS